MNRSIFLQAYLDGQLSHSEEAELRAALEALPTRTAEEETVLLMLRSDAPSQPTDAWWSDEGCDAYAAILATQAAAPAPAAAPRHSLGWWATRWGSGVAATAVLAFGLWTLRDAPPTAELAQAPASPTVTAPTTPSPTAPSPAAPVMSAPLGTDISPRPLPSASSLADAAAPKEFRPLAPSEVISSPPSDADAAAEAQIEADFLHYRLEERLATVLIELQYQQYLQQHPAPDADVHFVEL